MPAEKNTSGTPLSPASGRIPDRTPDHPARPAVGLARNAQEHQFSGRASFRRAILDLLQQAAKQGWRELRLADSNFQDWPLAERTCEAWLQEWAAPGRRLLMLAQSYTDLQSTQHRFVAWRRHWAHLIECRACPSWPPEQGPSLIWSPQTVLLRLNLLTHSGVVSHDPQRRIATQEQWDEWWRNSVPAFPAVTLGL